MLICTIIRLLYTDKYYLFTALKELQIPGQTVVFWCMCRSLSSQMKGRAVCVLVRITVRKMDICMRAHCLCPWIRPQHTRYQQPPPSEKKNQIQLQKNASWSKIKDILLLSSSAASPREGIWQFIKKIVLFSSSPVFNISSFLSKAHTDISSCLLLVLLALQALTDDSREGNVRKSKPRWSAVPHRSLVFLYCLISQWPLSDFGVSSCLQVFCVWV